MHRYSRFVWPVIALAVSLALVLAAFASLAFADGHGYRHGTSQDTTFGTRSTFAAFLTGANEVPPVSTQTTGVSGVAFDDDGARMAHTLYVFNGDEIISAHLHCGNPGENGPIVVPLFNDPYGTDVNGHLASATIDYSSIVASAQQCDSVIGYDINNVEELTEAIRAGDIYVNVHSQAHPDGVVRGQLVHILDTPHAKQYDASYRGDHQGSPMPGYSGY